MTPSEESFNTTSNTTSSSSTVPREFGDSNIRDTFFIGLSSATLVAIFLVMGLLIARKLRTTSQPKSEMQTQTDVSAEVVPGTSRDTQSFCHHHREVAWTFRGSKRGKKMQNTITTTAAITSRSSPRVVSPRDGVECSHQCSSLQNNTQSSSTSSPPPSSVLAAGAADHPPIYDRPNNNPVPVNNTTDHHHGFLPQGLVPINSAADDNCTYDYPPSFSVPINGATNNHSVHHVYNLPRIPVSVDGATDNRNDHRVYDNVPRIPATEGSTADDHNDYHVYVNMPGIPVPIDGAADDYDDHHVYDTLPLMPLPVDGATDDYIICNLPSSNPVLVGDGTDDHPIYYLSPNPVPGSRTNHNKCDHDFHARPAPNASVSPVPSRRPPKPLPRKLTWKTN